MVLYRRRRTTRRPLRRRRPAMRRRRVIRRNPRIHAPKKFCETVNLVTLQSIPGVATGTGYNFKANLNLCTNPTSLTNVFEQYCITGIKFMYVPRYQVSYLDADEGVQMPQIFIAENKINPTVPTTEGDLLQEDNLKIFPANRRWSKYVSKPKPYLTQEGQPPNTEIFAQTGSRFITWLPMTENGKGVDHLALRAWIGGNNSASTFNLGTVYAKVYYSLKEQH